MTRIGDELEARYAKTMNHEKRRLARKAIKDALKVHSGHMKNPKKAPSRASAAREMRDLKQAKSALTIGGAVKKRKTAMSQWPGFNK